MTTIQKLEAQIADLREQMYKLINALHTERHPESRMMLKELTDWMCDQQPNKQEAHDATKIHVDNAATHDEKPQPPNWNALLDAAKRPIPEDEKALLAEVLNAKPGDKLFTHAEIDSLLSDGLPEAQEVSGVDAVMAEIFCKLILHKTETRHVEKVVRPIIEKLVAERDSARILHAHDNTFSHAMKLKLIVKLDALKGGQE